MSTMWQKTLVYLGLVEEAEDLPEHQAAAAAPRRARRAEQETPVRVVDLDDLGADVTALPLDEPGRAHVRPVPAGEGSRAAVVAAREYGDVQAIGTRLKEFQPVVVDTSALDTEDARRVLDFVSGATFALGGRLQPLRPRVFLALPDGRELAPSERARIAELGYAKQRA